MLLNQSCTPDPDTCSFLTLIFVGLLIIPLHFAFLRILGSQSWLNPWRSSRDPALSCYKWENEMTCSRLFLHLSQALDQSPCPCSVCVLFNSTQTGFLELSWAPCQDSLIGTVHIFPQHKAHAQRHDDDLGDSSNHRDMKIRSWWIITAFLYYLEILLFLN